MKIQIVLLLYCLTLGKAARILAVFTTPSFSHQFGFQIIIKKLLERQHEIVMFTTDPIGDAKLKNLTEINLHHLYDFIDYTNFENFMKLSRVAMTNEFRNFSRVTSEAVFRTREFQEVLNNSRGKFDLVLLEWIANPSFAILGRKLGCPMIGMRSLELRLEAHDSVGNPTNPAFTSNIYGDFSNDFWGRLTNSLFTLFWRIQFYWLAISEAQNIVDTYLLGNTIDVKEALKDVNLIMTNTNPLFQGARPMVPAVVEIGGFHIGQREKWIPEDVLQFLDNSKRGVVYFNLGTVVKSEYIGKEAIKLLIDGFLQVPYDVIWKGDPNLIMVPDGTNVKLWDWLPQEEILRHRNVVLFITHGGLTSIFEAIHYGVPIISMPFMLDQHVNSDRIENLIIGKRLDIKNLTKKLLVTTIQEVAQNITYKETIKKLSTLFQDQPMKPLERALWWIEYVLRNGKISFLKSPVVNTGWIEYLLLDVVAFLISCFIFIIFSIWWLYHVIKFTLTFNIESKKIKNL